MGAASWVPQQAEPYFILFLMLRIAHKTIIAKTNSTIIVPILFYNLPHDSHVLKAALRHAGIAV